MVNDGYSVARKGGDLRRRGGRELTTVVSGLELRLEPGVETSSTWLQQGPRTRNLYGTGLMLHVLTKIPDIFTSKTAFDIVIG